MGCSIATRRCEMQTPCCMRPGDVAPACSATAARSWSLQFNLFGGARNVASSVLSSFCASRATQRWSSAVNPRCVPVASTSTPSVPSGCTKMPCVRSPHCQPVARSRYAQPRVARLSVIGHEGIKFDAAGVQCGVGEVVPSARRNGACADGSQRRCLRRGARGCGCRRYARLHGARSAEENGGRARASSRLQRAPGPPQLRLRRGRQRRVRKKHGLAGQGDRDGRALRHGFPLQPLRGVSTRQRVLRPRPARPATHREQRGSGHGQHHHVSARLRGGRVRHESAA